MRMLQFIKAEAKEKKKWNILKFADTHVNLFQELLFNYVLFLSIHNLFARKMWVHSLAALYEINSHVIP